MTNLFEHTSAYWAKYAAYEWRMAADGKEYLLPTPDAEASVYNPIPLGDQLVLDAINIGLLVLHKSPKDKIKDAIHHFACTYGLLGLMTALPTTPNFVEYEKVYLLKKPVHPARKHGYAGVHEPFLPVPDAGFPQTRC